MSFVLVTGCPRSGTTAVASWLLSTPGVLGSTETRRTIAARSMWSTAKRFWCFDPTAPLHAHQRATDLNLVKQLARDAALLMHDVPLDFKGVLVDKEPLEPVAFPSEDYAEYLQDVHDLWAAKLVCMVRNPFDVIASMMRRRWGYSAKDVEPKELSLHRCISIWKRSTRAVVRMSVVEPATTLLQSYENLCSSPEIESREISKFTGLPLSIFTPRPAASGNLDPHVLEETKWERQLLGCYDDREKISPCIVLLTGEPGTGKTTIAKEVARRLVSNERRVVVLDGDDMRRRLWPELKYNAQGRAESTRRALALSISVAAAGAVVLVSMVAPHEISRRRAGENAARAYIPFRIIRVTASRETRLRRRSGDVHDFVYEEPSTPNIVVDTDMVDIDRAVEMVLNQL